MSSPTIETGPRKNVSNPKKPALSHWDRSQVSKDPWLQPLYRFFDSLANRPAALVGIIVVVLAATATVVTYINRSESRNASANNAFFRAQKTLDDELKAWAQSVQPEAPSAGKGKKAEAPSADSVMYTKTDVDTRFADALSRFKAVIRDYSGTRAAFEARMAIGSLYYNHSEPTQAIPWYQQAVNAAPKTYDHVLALSALGYSQENAGQYSDAIQSYQKAINVGEGSLKGDLLLSIGRCYELLHDSAKARSTYDQIISQMPDTEQARTAELFKSQLPG